MVLIGRMNLINDAIKYIHKTVYDDTSTITFSFL